MYLPVHIKVSFGENLDSLLAAVYSISIDNSIDGIIGKCEIQCPLNARIKKDGNFAVEPARANFVAGTPVKVEAWYEGYPVRTLFTGYVYQFREGTPCTIVCEDEGYLLRKGLINKTWGEGVKLSDIVKYVAEFAGLQFENSMAADITFKQFEIKSASPLYTLQQIKQDTGIIISVVDGKVTCAAGSTTKGDIIKLRSDTNVLECDIQQPDGVWKKFYVTVKMKNEQGKDVEFTVGDPEGEVVAKDYSGAMSQQEVENFVNTQLLSTLQTGKFEGTITTALYPAVPVFGQIQYTDKVFSSLNGVYVVKQVNTTLGQGGCRQSLTVSQLTSSGE